MEKKIDLNRPIKDICKDYPEVMDIMKGFGFESITNPTMLNTVGRVMTIQKGARMKNIDLGKVKQAFQDHGFTIKEDL